MIRRAEFDDLHAVLSLMAQPDMDGGPSMSLEKARVIFDRLQKTSNHELYVAATDDAIVGTFALIVVQHLSHNGARSAVIEDVVVSASCQGQGIGRRMMEFAIERA